ncbi:LPXTG cell wall anchor domain-containing protein [Vagococcus fluvialis]|uniref:LPXTG cell wall anchor domain-containing protein n=1 Tax=Vagococcus fluvialis TaxID=2738 RepID=UPI003D1283FD
MKKWLVGSIVLNFMLVSLPVVTAEEATSNSTIESSMIDDLLPELTEESEIQEFNPNVMAETQDAMISAEKENVLSQQNEPKIIGGTAYFSDYGIEDDTQPADEALEKMIQNPKVTKIVSTSNIWFKERHTITRNNLEIDFGNYTVKNGEMADAANNDPFAAVLIFKGDNQGEKQQVTLKEGMKLYQEIFEVADSSEFELYDYYRVHVNARPGKVGTVGKQEKEIDKMIMVTEIIDKTHVKFNYRMGWELEAGRILTYDKVEPVRNVTVKNAKYYNKGKGELDSASLVSFEYVVEGNVSDVESYHTYWPAIMRRHNTHYYTIRTKLYNPIEVVVGGTGYLTQQIHTLYGTVKDNQTSAARHLNDFTGSAYSVVENNHATNDYHGGFVTHGQFEHDLTYINNTGLLSFANSGLTWGESARRITVKKHYGSWVIARTKITDLTLEDVEVHAEDYYPDSGKFLINADGAQLKGVTGDGVIFTQRSNRSRRPTSIEGSSFKKADIVITKEGPNAVTSEILLKDFPEEPTEPTESSSSDTDTSSSTDSSSSDTGTTSTSSSTDDSSSDTGTTSTSSSTDDSSSNTDTTSTSSSTDDSSSDTDTTSTSSSTDDSSNNTGTTNTSSNEKISEKQLINKTKVNPIYVGDKIIRGITIPNTLVSYGSTEVNPKSVKQVKADVNGSFELEVGDKLEKGDVVVLTLVNEKVTATIEQTVLEKEVGNGSNQNNNQSGSNYSNNDSTNNGKYLPKTGETISFLAPVGLIVLLITCVFVFKRRRVE